MDRITMRLPDRLLDRIDEHVDYGGYTDRSDLVRDAVRNLLDERDAKRRGDIVHVTLEPAPPSEPDAESSNGRRGFPSNGGPEASNLGDRSRVLSRNRCRNRNLEEGGKW